MFATGNRSVALDMFNVPSEYELDFALLTTSSLSLEAVCNIPIAIQLGKDTHHDSEDSEALQNLSFIDALQSAEDKLLIYYQEEMVSVPHSYSKVYGLLEQYLSR